MKQIMIYFLLAIPIFITGKLGAQKVTIPEVTLQEKTIKAELIFEGRFISSKAFKSDHGINTCNYYLVSREFKGVFPSDTIRMITDGGTLNGETETVSETTGIPAEGIFFCNSMSAGYYNFGSGSIYYPLNAEQGSISYFHGRIQCESQIYKDLQKDVYAPIEQFVGQPCKQVRPNSLEQAIIDDNAKKEQLKKDEAERKLEHETVVYTISNVNYQHDPAAKFPVRQFGIFVSGNNDPKLFVSGDVYLDYDTSVWGTNIVSQKKFTVKLADVNPKVYSLTVTDAAPGIIKCSIISKGTHGNSAELDTIVREQDKKRLLLHCTVQFDRVQGQKYLLRLDKEKMEGHSKYYDTERKSILNFPKVFLMGRLSL